jgi:medium-chain acyl-[acyl-carrier-protein] hydrolase
MTPSRLSFDLKTYELDFHGRVPVAVIYRFMQEAAEHDAVERQFDTETLLRKNLTWMLLRMQIRFQNFPEGRQEIEVETWPSGIDSRYAFREFRLFAAKQQNLFAVASSVWLLIDRERQRPVQLAPFFDPSDRQRTEPMVVARQPEPNPSGEVLLRKEFPVRLADLDINNHVNNLHYLEWVVESVPEEYWAGRTIVELDLEYKKQVMYGDTVRVETVPASGGGFFHRMTSPKTTGDILTARTVWK